VAGFVVVLFVKKYGANTVVLLLLFDGGHARVGLLVSLGVGDAVVIVVVGVASMLGSCEGAMIVGIFDNGMRDGRGDRWLMMVSFFAASTLSFRLLLLAAAASCCCNGLDHDRQRYNQVMDHHKVILRPFWRHMLNGSLSGNV